MRTWKVLACAALAISGCTVGPNYQKPSLPAPAAFRDVPDSGNSSVESVGDMKWWEVFKDDALQELIRTAQTQNYDLRQATVRVDAAEASLGITRSNQFPNVTAGATETSNRLSRNGSVPLSPLFPSSQVRSYGGATLGLLSFEIDIWGRLRRATEAARADLMASTEVRKAVLTTLVSDVAANYFSLRELDAELEISQRTLETRQETLRLIQARQAGGVGTLLDLRQAEQLVDTAAATIPLIEQQIAQTENRISLLLGRNPAAVQRGKSLVDQDMLPEIPTGLPSELIERRPDIRAAEQTLVSTNARIGVAKAAYFPQLSLTGFLGGQSTQLASLLSTPNRIWNFSPQVGEPVFTAGRIGSNVKLAEDLRESALIQYEKVIQTAFGEVSDSLIAHEKVRESRVEQERLVTALQDRNRLAYVRYRGGVDTLLNALDADRDLFQAQLSLSRIRLSELLSVVQLYKALGGGWQQ